MGQRYYYKEHMADAWSASPSIMSIKAAAPALLQVRWQCRPFATQAINLLIIPSLAHFKLARAGPMSLP
jgi:hypothetical protein